MKRIPVLVYGELREVAHELLARRDLDLRWAMTLEEALAVSRQVDIDLVISSDAYALEYLQHRPASSRKAACIAVVGPECSGTEHLEAGATVVAARDSFQILEAVSELTGLAFRLHPRAAVETVVDVTFRGKSYYLTTIDLSASGVGVVGFPEAGYGDRAIVRFDMFDPHISAPAMVVRTFTREGEFCAGLCFTDLSAKDRAQLRDLVEVQRNEPTIDPIVSAPGNDTHDLLTLLSRESDRGLNEYMRLLKDKVSGTHSRTPTWLSDVAAELTDTERRSLEKNEQSWARAAIGMRIELRRHLLDDKAPFDAAAALDLCRLMALETISASDEVACDAATIRAHVLRDAAHLARSSPAR